MAVRQYRLAAENGLKQAQATLGQIYELGEIVKPDYEEAERWYRQAIQQGDTRCATRLGAMFFQGGIAVGISMRRSNCGAGLLIAGMPTRNSILRECIWQV